MLLFFRAGCQLKAGKQFGTKRFPVELFTRAQDLDHDLA